jgi:hypothetical protein
MAPSAAATATGRPTEPRASLAATHGIPVRLHPPKAEADQRHSRLLKGAALAPTGCIVVEACGAK